MPDLIALGTAFFGAVSEISSLIPDFGEKRRKELAELTASIINSHKRLRDYALEFNEGSSSDVLFGLSEDVKVQEKLYKEKIVIYAKELRG